MIVGLAVGQAFGCPYSVRQVGFAMLRRQPYRIFCFVEDKMPGLDRFKAAFDAAGVVLDESNVDAVLVNVDREKEHDALAYREQMGSDRLPAAVLVSPRDDVLPLPGAASAATLRAEFERVVFSPKRDALVDHIITQWCVVLLVEGSDREDNERAKREVDAGTDAFAHTMTLVGTNVDRPPYLLVVQAKDAEEQILLWSLGLGKGEKPRAQAVVLFGQGRQFGPVLAGPSLTRTRLLGILSSLGMNCACTTDTSFLASPVVPLQWGADLQQRVRLHVGLDPTSPKVRMELARLWKDMGWDGGASVGFMGYREGRIEYTEDRGEDEEAVPYVIMPTIEQKRPAAAARSSGSASARGAKAWAATSPDAPAPSPVALAEPRSGLERRTGLMLLIVFVGMVFVVAAGSGLILWRKRST